MRLMFFRQLSRHPLGAYHPLARTSNYEIWIDGATRNTGGSPLSTPPKVSFRARCYSLERDAHYCCTNRLLQFDFTERGEAAFISSGLPVGYPCLITALLGTLALHLFEPMASPFPVYPGLVSILLPGTNPLAHWTIRQARLCMPPDLWKR